MVFLIRFKIDLKYHKIYILLVTTFRSKSIKIFSAKHLYFILHCLLAYCFSLVKTNQNLISLSSIWSQLFHHQHVNLFLRFDIMCLFLAILFLRCIRCCANKLCIRACICQFNKLEPKQILQDFSHTNKILNALLKNVCKCLVPLFRRLEVYINSIHPKKIWTFGMTWELMQNW